MKDLFFNLSISHTDLTEDEVELIKGHVNTCCHNIEQVKPNLSISLDVSEE